MAEGQSVPVALGLLSGINLRGGKRQMKPRNLLGWVVVSAIASSSSATAEGVSNPSVCTEGRCIGWLVLAPVRHLWRGIGSGICGRCGFPPQSRFAAA